ncbi:LysR family transcriptional regulator [Pigmentiphaga aceris]|uniref:LysR family transcriptional regulator n=1 Tax=Pigmentiphaga aceris TaxID=1940612 RepID=A0A5C0AUZ5_9BURK|nr:LysR family transcriptional regulator [Pigmentiphaga aceris]QEI05163.1 LysR family transcriptional regulator [Pigmentiphaga aceris]
MDRFQEMQVFIRIAERLSFSQAADDLQIPRATVTNLMKRMETRLGTRLLERTTRTVRLTQDGEAHLRRCERLIADLEEAEGSFNNAAPQGLLRVNLQGTLAKHIVVPALPAFLAMYPAIELHIGEDDRLIDLVREGVDCVLRVGNLPDSSMVGRRVAMMEQVTVASPAYLQKHGEPTTLDELAGHYAVNYVSSASGRAMPLEFLTAGQSDGHQKSQAKDQEKARPDSQVIAIHLPGMVSVSGADLYAGSVVAGLGLAQVPTYRIASELAAGQLKIVLPDFPPPAMPVTVMYPQNRQLSLRVRVFAQWLYTLFRDARWPVQDGTSKSASSGASN